MKPARPTFGQRMIYAFVFCLIVHFIAQAVQIFWLYNLAWSIVGVTLIIWPDVPANLRMYWPEDKCRRFGRLLGVCCIIGAWLVRIGPTLPSPR